MDRPLESGLNGDSSANSRQARIAGSTKFGGGGNDTLDGGVGADSLDGSSGSD
jgi:Ca2+-binding RTX toxin-like protein